MLRIKNKNYKSVAVFGLLFIGYSVLLHVVRWAVDYEEEGNLLVNSFVAGILTALTLAIFSLFNRLRKR